MNQKIRLYWKHRVVCGDESLDEWEYGSDIVELPEHSNYGKLENPGYIYKTQLIGYEPIPDSVDNTNKKENSKINYHF